MNTINTLAVNDLQKMLPPRLNEQKEDELVQQALLILYGRLRKKENIMFTSPAMVKDYISLHLQEKEHEVFVGLFLDNQHRLIESRDLFFGTINQCAIYPREVVKHALSLNAAALILAHNHPSGSIEPSEGDKAITQHLKEALRLINVVVLDHLIVGSDDVLSFADRGLL